MRKKPEFVLINPNLTQNPRLQVIPCNLTPGDHLNNSLDFSENMDIKKLLTKTFKEAGIQDIIDCAIANNDHSKLSDTIKGLVEYFESKNMIKGSPDLVISREAELDNTSYRIKNN